MVVVAVVGLVSAEGSLDGLAIDLCVCVGGGADGGGEGRILRTVEAADVCVLTCGSGLVLVDVALPVTEDANCDEIGLATGDVLSNLVALAAVALGAVGVFVIKVSVPTT